MDGAREALARARDAGGERLTFELDGRATQGLDIVASHLTDAPEGDGDCDVCGASGNEDATILCDGCDRGCVCDNARAECA